MTPRASSEVFDDELLQIVFDGNYDSIHRDIREVLFDPLFDAYSQLTMDEAGHVSYDRSRLMHSRLEQPLEILKNPQRLFALAEWPGLCDIACFSLLMVHYNLCLGTVFEHGSQNGDTTALLHELNAMKCFGPYMATELGYGNNVAALRTEAVYDHERRSFILNTPDAAAQKYMSYSGFRDIPKIAVVMARLMVDSKDCGVFPFLVRICTEQGLCEGVRAVPCPEKPVQGLDNGLTWFDHVRIPAGNILLGGVAEISDEGKFKAILGNPRARFLRAMSRIIPGRLCVSSSAAGLGRASVYIALRYAQKRLTNAPGSSGTAVIEYRSHQLATFTGLAKVYAITLLVNRVKRDYVAEGGAPSAGTLNLINIVKAVSTWEMADVITMCRERCGAQGIFSANRIVDYGLLLSGLITAEGDNQVLLANTAGQILAQPWTEEITPARSAPAAGVTDATWMIDLFRFREHALWSSARETKARNEEQGYFESWNSVINTGIELVRLRGMRLALECLLEATSSAKGTDIASALGILCSIFGLGELSRNSGWYVAHGALSAEQVIALPSAADALCSTLRPFVPRLIDGFALTPELLRAPIAADDYVAAFCEHAESAAAF